MFRLDLLMTFAKEYCLIFMSINFLVLTFILPKVLFMLEQSWL